MGTKADERGRAWGRRPALQPSSRAAACAAPRATPAGQHAPKHKSPAQSSPHLPGELPGMNSHNLCYCNYISHRVLDSTLGSCPAPHLRRELPPAVALVRRQRLLRHFGVEEELGLTHGASARQQRRLRPRGGWAGERGHESPGQARRRRHGRQRPRPPNRAMPQRGR